MLWEYIEHIYKVVERHMPWKDMDVPTHGWKIPDYPDPTVLQTNPTVQLLDGITDVPETSAMG